MLRLATRADVMPPLIALLVAVVGGAIVSTTMFPGLGRSLLLGLLIATFLGTSACCLLKLRFRLCRLLSGHCPNPLCHGVVHHSDLVPRGMVLCPTCGRRWPDIEGIQFRVTVREH